jgi:cysteine desulfurase / selenocysteine lyase
MHFGSSSIAESGSIFAQETTVRPSFAFYNTCGEIDVLVSALKDIQAETGLTRL